MQTYPGLRGPGLRLVRLSCPITWFPLFSAGSAPASPSPCLFRQWVIPEPLVFGFIAGALLKISVKFLSLPEDNWVDILGSNLLVFFGSLYIMGGFSIIAYYLQKWKVSFGFPLSPLCHPDLPFRAPLLPGPSGRMDGFPEDQNPQPWRRPHENSIDQGCAQDRQKGRDYWRQRKVTPAISSFPTAWPWRPPKAP